MPNLARYLCESAQRHPERPALRLGPVTVTYAELDEQSARVAALLRERGVAVGDRVALMLPNVPEFVALYYGVLRAGAVVVPMNPLLKARETDYYLRDSGAALLFAWHTADAVAGSDTPVLTVRPGFEGLALPGADTGEPVPVPDRDHAVLLYTSGTTGRPKGAALGHGALARNVETFATTVLGLTPDDVLLGCLPLFHTFGQTCAMNSAVVSGASLTLLPRFDPQAALDTLADHRVTVFAGVPTMYSLLLHHPSAARAELPSLRICVSGGSSLPVELLHGFEQAFHCTVLEGYGLSETSPVVSFNHPDRPRRPGSVGTPIEGVEVRLLDEAGAEVAPGRTGEVAVRGPSLMTGYWQRPEETAEAVPDGWLRTGDLARQDDDGYLYIVDRKKDLIIRAGYNVYPREVEEVLYEHPDVFQAVVVGIADPLLGQEVAAAVVLRPGAQTDPGTLLAFVKERVAPYKYPRRIWLLDALPTGPSGKILRRAVLPPPTVGTTVGTTVEETTVFDFTSSDGLTVLVHSWTPGTPPRGVVQLAHGMGEHALRYAPLARALTAAGYAVYADDHRGHGLSMLPGRPGALGTDGWNLLVEDLAALTRIIRARHPGLPVYLLGHSLGSFAAQQFLLDHADLVDGVALCGTTAVDALFEHLAGELAAHGGEIMDTFNAPFQPARTPADWLSRDEEQVDRYLADPLCGFALDEESMTGLAVAGSTRLAAPRGIPCALPLYVLVGDQDPLNVRLALSDQVVARYHGAGLTDVTYRSYPGARHELFNETNRDQVVADLLTWLDQHPR